MSNARILQLDISGKPTGLISWTRAVTLLWEKKAISIEEEEGKYWRSPSVSIPKSLIIQTHDYVKLHPLKENQVIKRVLFGRDKYICQYCSKQLTRHTATIDHVIPKSKFLKDGKPASEAHTYSNCVTSCAKCNTKKGDKLPFECGMMPITTPKIPSYVQVLWGGKLYCPIQAEYVSMYFKVDKKTLLAKPLN